MSSEEDLLEKKNNLVERIGVYFEKAEQLPPVGARILASITLTCKQGITFEQLVQEMNASKSTVSTHLSNLENIGRIEYFTKPGDRKRYYTPPHDGFIKFIDEKIRELESECKLHEDVIRYKEIANNILKEHPEAQCNVKFNKDVILMLKEHIALLNKWKEN